MFLSSDYTRWLERQIQNQIVSVEAMRESGYMNWPRHVQVETVALCDAACAFCPYPGLARKGARLSDQSIAKILADLAMIPRNLAFEFAPYNVNEPFLDDRLPDILDEVDNKLPHAQISLVTNGTRLTDVLLARIARLRNVAYLWISVNACQAQDYQRLMKLDFNETVARLRTIQREKQSGDFAHKVVISRVMDGSEADEQFLQWGKQEFPEFETGLLPRQNWIGQIESAKTLAEVPRLPCKRWFGLSILANGVATMCCMDGRGEWALGDIAATDLASLYNSATWRAVRKSALDRLDTAGCRACTCV